MLFRSGTGTIAPQLKTFRPFKQARDYARQLNIKSQTEWRAFSTTGKLPVDIPSNPNVTYKDNGWAGYADWLGTGNKRRVARK